MPGLADGRRTVLAGVLAVCSCCAWAFETEVDGFDAGPIRVSCPKDGGWSFDAKGAKVSPGVVELSVDLSSATASVPPEFSVAFDVPQVDAHHKWTPRNANVTLPPNWDGTTRSRLCQSLPLVSFLNDTDRNRILVAASEAKRSVRIEAGLREEDCRIVFRISFFTEPEAPRSSYGVRIRIDRRDVFFGDAIREGTAWIERTADLKPDVPPPDAFEPLYSAWYSFHQDVSDREIEAECAEAAKLGMKVLIVDDGWQTDDNNRGYAYTGDWEISKRRFPDMAAHVRKVHGLGLKYMVWYGVPMMGVRAKNYGRFKGKFLWEMRGRWSDYACLDPRFPEVRDYICSLYEKALREWDIDGFKLDFIDSFGFHGEDPAVREDYAGRDIKALPEAVDRLLSDVFTRLRAIKPDVLVEFRQGYIGPAVRQYGNMMRAADCPGDLLANRVRTANLRLTSGISAVHSDMLEWNVSDTPENAARFVLSAMFSTIQYSVMLRTLPDDHKRMVAHWLGFSRRHRNALLKGWFRPRHFEANYPLIEAGDGTETIIGCYQHGTVVPVPADGKPVLVLDGTGTGDLVLDLPAAATARLVDTFGVGSGSVALEAGLNRMRLPRSGYVELGGTSFTEKKEK